MPDSGTKSTTQTVSKGQQFDYQSSCPLTDCDGDLSRVSEVSEKCDECKMELFDRFNEEEKRVLEVANLPKEVA